VASHLLSPAIIWPVLSDVRRAPAAIQRSLAPAAKDFQQGQTREILESGHFDKRFVGGYEAVDQVLAGKIKRQLIICGLQLAVGRERELRSFLICSGRPISPLQSAQDVK
jgi:hypothetical protein